MDESATAFTLSPFHLFTFNVLAGLSGLSVGQMIDVPGSQITEAVKRYWRNGLFSKVSITADSIVGSSTTTASRRRNVRIWRRSWA